MPSGRFWSLFRFVAGQPSAFLQEETCSTVLPRGRVALSGGPDFATLREEERRRVVDLGDGFVAVKDTIRSCRKSINAIVSALCRQLRDASGRKGLTLSRVGGRGERQEGKSAGQEAVDVGEHLSGGRFGCRSKGVCGLGCS
jgi:hypothetical protein